MESSHGIFEKFFVKIVVSLLLWLKGILMIVLLIERKRCPENLIIINPVPSFGRLDGLVFGRKRVPYKLTFVLVFSTSRCNRLSSQPVNITGFDANIK